MIAPDTQEKTPAMDITAQKAIIVANRVIQAVSNYANGLRKYTDSQVLEDASVRLPLLLKELLSTSPGFNQAQVQPQPAVVHAPVAVPVKPPQVPLQAPGQPPPLTYTPATAPAPTQTVLSLADGQQLQTHSSSDWRDPAPEWIESRDSTLYPEREAAEIAATQEEHIRRQQQQEIAAQKRAQVESRPGGSMDWRNQKDDWLVKPGKYAQSSLPETRKELHEKPHYLATSTRQIKSYSLPPRPEAPKPRIDPELQLIEEQENVLKGMINNVMQPKEDDMGLEWRYKLRTRTARREAARLEDIKQIRDEEQKKWSSIPDWKRSIIELKRTKQARLDKPRLEEERARQKRLEKLDSMPIWKRNLILKKNASVQQ
eukprot:UC4_evm8s1233